MACRTGGRNDDQLRRIAHRHRQPRRWVQRGALAEQLELAPKPNGYPLWPARLSIGDWVYDYSGIANTASVQAALDYHIAKKTLLILLIHDSVTGSGGRRVYHVVRPGAFLLRGYNLSGSVYFDLVYIDTPATISCTKA
jgi:hypothetical protein